MKQIIVLISGIALGIALAGMVLGFETDASALTDAVSTQITELRGNL